MKESGGRGRKKETVSGKERNGRGSKTVERKGKERWEWICMVSQLWKIIFTFNWSCAGSGAGLDWMEEKQSKVE